MLCNLSCVTASAVREGGITNGSSVLGDPQATMLYLHVFFFSSRSLGILVSVSPVNEIHVSLWSPDIILKVARMFENPATCEHAHTKSRQGFLRLSSGDAFASRCNSGARARTLINKPLSQSFTHSLCLYLWMKQLEDLLEQHEHVSCSGGKQACGNQISYTEASEAEEVGRRDSAPRGIGGHRACLSRSEEESLQNPGGIW